MSCSNQAEASGQAPNEEGPALMPRKKVVRRVEKGICQRCQVAKSYYIIRTVTYCPACFEANVHFRLSRQLFPPLRSPSIQSRSVKMSMNRPPKQAGNALIALSGGAGSMAMLEILLNRGFIGDGKGEEGKVVDKRAGEKEVIWDKGTVVYVEFCGVTQGGHGQDRTEEMRTVAESKGLAFVGLRAEDVYDQDLAVRLGLQNRTQGDQTRMTVDLARPNLPLAPSLSSSSTSTPLTALQNLLSSVPSSSRPSILSTILDHLITLTAQSIPNISHVLYGETSSRQAERVISGTALGRGWSLPLELAAAMSISLSSMPLLQDDTRVSSSAEPASIRKIVRLKPMKDITIKEAAFLCRIKRQETVNIRGWAVVGGAGSSSAGGSEARGKGGIATLEMLTEQFVAGLSVTHPSTVSTINRTGDKLVFPGEVDNESTCPICQLPVDPSALDWKSRTALTYLPNKPNASSVESSITTDEPATGLAPLLCYACLTTYTSSRPGRHRDTGPVSLPLWIGERAIDRSNRAIVGRQEMAQEIKEFIIPQDE